MPNICVQTKKSFLEIYLRQPTPLLVLVLLFGPHLGSAAPPTTAIKQPQGTVAGYQSADDCNSNYVLDEIEHMNGQLFIEPLQGLSGFYGGIIGTGHSSHYDFSDEFLIVRSVWLRLRGTADQSTGNPVNLQFSVRVDGVALASTSLSNLNEYEVCIPLPTTRP